MKSLEIDKKGTFSKEEKENFFQQLENNKEFFKEAFEAMLTIVVSDPKLTEQVAGLIEKDYQNFQIAIVKEQKQPKKNDLPGCCQTH